MALKERGVSMWARLMTQLVHTRRAYVHIPCVSCVLVIVSTADLRPYSFEPQHGLDERVDEAADSDEDGGGDDASVYDDSLVPRRCVDFGLWPRRLSASSSGLNSNVGLT